MASRSRRNRFTRRATNEVHHVLEPEQPNRFGLRSQYNQGSDGGGRRPRLLDFGRRGLSWRRTHWRRNALVLERIPEDDRDQQFVQGIRYARTSPGLGSCIGRDNTGSLVLRRLHQDRSTCLERPRRLPLTGAARSHSRSHAPALEPKLAESKESAGLAPPPVRARTAEIARH